MKNSPGKIIDELKKDDGRLMGEIVRSFTGDRRSFVAALGATGLGMLLAKGARAAPVGPLNTTQRRDRAFDIRNDRALENRNNTSLTISSHQRR